MFLQSFKSVGLSVQEKKRKTNFDDCRQEGYIGFQIETILAIFDLQVTTMFPTKLQVNRPFGSGGEAKKKIYFQDLGFQIGSTAATFDSQVTPMLPTKFQVK